MYNLVNILKTTELYTLKVWSSWGVSDFYHIKSCTFIVNLENEIARYPSPLEKMLESSVTPEGCIGS